MAAQGRLAHHESEVNIGPSLLNHLGPAPWRVVRCFGPPVDRRRRVGRPVRRQLRLAPQDANRHREILSRKFPRAMKEQRVRMPGDINPSALQIARDFTASARLGVG